MPRPKSIARIEWQEIADVGKRVNRFLPSLEVRRQPQDGNCLFHALGFFAGCTAGVMRSRLCDFMLREGHHTMITDGTIKEWIEWSGEMSVAAYIGRMRKHGEWGSAIEISAFCMSERLNVTVCARADQGAFRAIAQVCPCPDARRTVHVLYSGNHYDALVTPGWLSCGTTEKGRGKPTGPRKKAGRSKKGSTCKPHVCSLCKKPGHRRETCPLGKFIAKKRPAGCSWQPEYSSPDPPMHKRLARLLQVDYPTLCSRD